MSDFMLRPEAPIIDRTGIEEAVKLAEADPAPERILDLATRLQAVIDDRETPGDRVGCAKMAPDGNM